VIPLATQSARTLGYTRTTFYGVTGTRSMVLADSDLENMFFQGVLVIFSILHHLDEIKKYYLNMAPAPAFALALLERSPGSTRGAGVPN
jgi:hypothetical protein